MCTTPRKHSLCILSEEHLCRHWQEWVVPWDLCNVGPGGQRSQRRMVGWHRVSAQDTLAVIGVLGGQGSYSHSHMAHRLLRHLAF